MFSFLMNDYVARTVNNVPCVGVSIDRCSCTKNINNFPTDFLSSTLQTFKDS